MTAQMGPGWHNFYSDLLQVGWSEVRTLMGAPRIKISIVCACISMLWCDVYL